MRRMSGLSFWELAWAGRDERTPFRFRHGRLNSGSVKNPRNLKESFGCLWYDFVGWGRYGIGSFYDVFMYFSWKVGELKSPNCFCKGPSISGWKWWLTDYFTMCILQYIILDTIVTENYAANLLSGIRTTRVPAYLYSVQYATLDVLVCRAEIVTVR